MSDPSPFIMLTKLSHERMQQHVNTLESENARLRRQVQAADALLRNAVNLYDAVFDYSAYRCDWDTVLEAWESFDDDDATLDAYRAANTEGE